MALHQYFRTESHILIFSLKIVQITWLRQRKPRTYPCIVPLSCWFRCTWFKFPPALPRCWLLLCPFAMASLQYSFKVSLSILSNCKYAQAEPWWTQQTKIDLTVLKQSLAYLTVTQFVNKIRINFYMLRICDGIGKFYLLYCSTRACASGRCSSKKVISSNSCSRSSGKEKLAFMSSTAASGTSLPSSCVLFSDRRTMSSS